MKYITKRMIIVLNKMAIKMAGGTALIGTNIRVGQSLGFIERIVANELFGVPLYPDMFHQAAAYMFYIIENHTFNDGNKRTGLLAAITFLTINSIYFSGNNDGEVFDFVMSIASGENDPESVIPLIADWLKKQSVY